MNVAIISSRRPHAVEAMEAQGWEGTWYVGRGESPAYRAAGAARVVEGGGLVESRNAALDDAFARDELCIQVSDDCTKIERWDGAEKHPIDPAELIFTAGCHITPNCRLVGVAPTANSFYASQKVKRKHFIVGDFMVIAPTPLRFDPALRLKEDYDFTAQHIRAYGEVARLDWLLVTFKHRTNRGGAVDYRTAELEHDSIRYLRSKWGNWIRENPRRPNEVLLRV